MSQPRFLANHDFKDAIVNGVLRRGPTVYFRTARAFGAERLSDRNLLELASREGLIVVSHDVNTMSSHAYTRIQQGLPMTGLILAAQTAPIASTINDLIAIALASEAEEYHGVVMHLPL